MKQFFVLLGLFSFLLLGAQPQVRLVQVSVTPNSKDWTLDVGEKAKFEINVLQSNIALEDVKVDYELSYDMMTPFEKKEIVLKNGKAIIDAGTMTKPGFLRCIARVTHDGIDYQGLATVGFSPKEIKPTVKYPDDFLTFWKKAIDENAQIPLEPTMELLRDRSTATVDVYHISFQNYRFGSRIYGILSIPKREGKFPAFLKVPGAGVRGYSGDVITAEKGVIILEIGVNGVPVNMDPSLYSSLSDGALHDYWLSNWDDIDRVYYKRVYVGCVKAIDFIFSLDRFDGENVVVQGGSQGGALSVVTAALDKRVKGLICYYPALSDLTGYLYGRAGGWPHLFRNNPSEKCVLDEKVKVASYYDVVNFARQIDVPGYYSFGYNDMVCPPTSVFSVINSVTAPKEIKIVPETEHWDYHEQRKMSVEWGLNLLFNLHSR